jgi:hypothetical protein
MASKTVKRKSPTGPSPAPAERAAAASERGVDSPEPVPPGAAAPDAATEPAAIRARAYELWERAGSPEHRAGEFWLEAERQLQEEAYP